MVCPQSQCGRKGGGGSTVSHALFHKASSYILIDQNTKSLSPPSAFTLTLDQSHYFKILAGFPTNKTVGSCRHCTTLRCNRATCFLTSHVGAKQTRFHVISSNSERWRRGVTAGCRGSGFSKRSQMKVCVCVFWQSCGNEGWMTPCPRRVTWRSELTFELPERVGG